MRRFILALACVCVVRLAAHADPDKKLPFDIPAGNAVDAVKQFATQSGVQLLYAADDLKGVQTNAVQGEHTPFEAAGILLAGTGLSAVQGPNGAIGITRANGPNAPGAAPIATASARPPSENQIVALSPFEVQEDSDKSYGALNSNSITQFNVALDHLPVSADIFDQAFMTDVGATDVESMISSYSAGAAEGAPTGGTTTYYQNQPGDQVGNSSMRLRGQTTQTMQLNSLLLAGHGGNSGGSYGLTSNFDLERVEIINGPQAMLYEGGGAGGVINLVSKEARIGQPTFGSAEFRIDEYGSKYGQLDYGTSEGIFAVRVALIDTTNDSRRIDIGDFLSGGYVQLAAQLGKTTVRLSLQQTTDQQTNSDYETITAAATSAYARFSGLDFGYLLATGQIGAIDNGKLNWNNIASLAGDWASDTRVDEFGTLEADTQWTDWLSTQVSVAYANDNINTGGSSTSPNFYAPDTSTNPLPGNWTEGGAAPAGYLEPDRNKSGRVSALFTNDLFGGRAKSQSILGTDYVGGHSAHLEFSYYAADSNFNVLENPSLVSASNPGGRTQIAAQSWPVDGGPVLYPLFKPGSPQITLNGVNYVRQLEDPVSKALVGPGDPLGTTIMTGGSEDQVSDYVNDGIYGMNYTSWLDGRLDTLIGIRYERSTQYTVQEGQIPPSLGTLSPGYTKAFSYSFGSDYHLTPWLAPYFTISDSVAPPADSFGVAGPISPTSEAVGEEVGAKVNLAGGRLSGSLALYHVNDKNNFFMLTASLGKDINPSGLNGTNGVYANGFEANETSQGLELTVTANPVNNWRIRLSGAVTQGTFESNVVYPQEYNDQFNENSAGDVTYADGNVVYVLPAFNSKQLTVSSTTAGAVPLTVTSLSTPSNAYFATPFAVSGQITGSSPGGQVLKGGTDPANPASRILTGVTGLPISDYQLNPTLAGITIPGSIVLAEQGQDTYGYPEFSANLTSVYEFTSGCIKGFKIGGTVAASWKNRGYNYFYQGYTGPTSPQELFYLPTIDRVDLITGYTRKFKRITWTTQLNVYNMFNSYDVIVYPYPVTAYATLSNLKGNFDQQPRQYVWTNTVSF